MRAVLLWGIADAQIEEVVLFFPTCEEAEHELALMLADEPSWREILSVVAIDFASPEPAAIPIGNRFSPPDVELPRL
jgi:hypothetical protein